MNYLDALEEFTIDTLPDLDIVVLGALERLTNLSLPSTTIPFHRPLIVGSGNAEITGRIIFKEHDAVFANESNYQQFLHKINNLDGVVIVSASGGKHSISIAETIQKYKLPLMLFTNNPQAKATQFIDNNNIRTFPKNREPYTYNTSTYLSMILADTGENASDIKDFIIENIANLDVFQTPYQAYTFIIPAQFEQLKPMLRTKFDELFGPKISARFFTPEEIKHAKTVVSDSKEVFISIGTNNQTFGLASNRIEIPLRRTAQYGEIIAVGYYLVGLIQKNHPPYFKDSIISYCKEASNIFNEEIKPIID